MKLRIRKLTPKEYWRLQGFTDEDFEKAQKTGLSNSQLYKQAGNSICVPVVQGIFKNLLKTEGINKMTETKITTEKYDIIERPQHYACESVTVSYTVEPIELCEMCGFLLGNALKYLFRYQHKGKPLEDLMKAQYYLRRYKKRGDHVNTMGWHQENKIALAFKDKDFFKYCNVAEGSLFIDDGLLQFVDEKIAEYQMKSVEMGK